MKKLFLFAMVMLAASTTFAQKSNVNKAQDLALQDTPDAKGAYEAIELAFQNEDTKNDAKTYYVAGLIGEKENDNYVKSMMLNKKVDENKKGEAIMKSIGYYLIADSLDNLPNEKGKVKPKYDKKIKEALKDYYTHNYNLIGYGAALYDAKKYDEAYKVFNTYLALPDNPLMKGELPKDSTYNMIEYYGAAAATNSGDYNAAIKLYGDLKDKNYETKNVYQLLANTYNQKKDTVNYLATLKEGFSKFSDEPWFLQNIINHYIYSNQIDKALNYLDEAIEKSPNVAEYYAVKGNIEDRLGKVDDAQAAFTKALDLDSNSALANSGMGRSIFNQGVEIVNNLGTINDTKTYNAEKAKADELFKKSLPYLKKAVELNPDDMDYKQALKMLYYRLNMQEEYDAISKEMNN